MEEERHEDLEIEVIRADAIEIRILLYEEVAQLLCERLIEYMTRRQQLVGQNSLRNRWMLFVGESYGVSWMALGTKKLGSI